MDRQCIINFINCLKNVLLSFSNYAKFRLYKSNIQKANTKKFVDAKLQG